MLELLTKMLIGGSGKNAMLDTMLEVHDAKAMGLPHLVHPADDADPRQPFTSTIPESELSIAQQGPRQKMRMLPIMLPLMRAMNTSASFYKKPFLPDGVTSTTAASELFDEVQHLVRSMGGKSAVWVHVPDDAIFKGKGIPHRQALLFSVQMDKAALDTSPSFESFLEVARCYKQMALISNAVTRLLRKRGHAAYPGTALGGLTDYSRLGEIAGLGTIGYHGLLITPDEGALLRLNTVYVSIENIPEPPPNPTAWIRDFCSMCHKCVRSCPPQAIHHQPEVQANGRVACIESQTCLNHFAANHGCAVCADVCPFSQRGYAEVQARFKGNADAPQYVIDVGDGKHLRVVA